ncbi:nuclease [Haloprofundus marisrubri]|uniref:Nuclease n=1 Tax=Haloprofundus marisrubri TaxID=1514971 RepID=A0A0W1R7C4_9EURY|nr:DNA double-strand break repair nuclease NurA [Haloprofundus marisrubri]KTG09323.1 nuclease [Haloprofundus marisrubri]
MTLDPVHVDGIAALARELAENVDDTDHTDLARTVWDEWLDPLRYDGRTVVEPLGEQSLRAADIDDIALADRPFETVHGLDSGTINPTTFENGLVLDMAHAAMASVPSDLELHRSRSIVLTTHTNDRYAKLGTEWQSHDDEYSRLRVLQAPNVNRYAEGVVHALSLYLAESEHALRHADDVSDLLILDGPIYPKELFNWRDRDAELRELAAEAKPKHIVENYVRLVERFVDRDVPLVGFVKNPISRLVTRTLQTKGVDAPWADDTALFSRLLERRTRPDAGGEPERLTDDLTFTSWFVSRGGSDRTLAADGDALGVDRELDPELYEVTFFVVYDPRHGVLYKVEAPYAFTRDDDRRAKLTRQILHDVAGARGPPPAVTKADELARISAHEKGSLRRKLAEDVGSDYVRTYNGLRWGDLY